MSNFLRTIRRYPLIALYFLLVWGGIYVSLKPPVTPKALAQSAPIHTAVSD